MKFCAVNFIETQQISVNDRGLCYGDGVFTTASIVDGQIALWHYHHQRLLQACRQLNISNLDFNYLSEYVANIAKLYQHAVLKIMITAGCGGRGYARGNQTANVIVQVVDFPKHYGNWQQQGVHLGIANTQLGDNPRLAGIKHLNRLEQVLIKQELAQPNKAQFDDLLVADIHQNLVETSASNVFWLQNNTWYTPTIKSAGVNGVMRQYILQYLLPDTQVLTQNLASVVEGCQAMFICNSLMQIVPVKRINQKMLDMTPVHELQLRLKHKLCN